MNEKIENLLKEMTVEEKAEICSGASWWKTAAIERLDIPAIMMADGPHGLRKQDKDADHVGINESVEAICFPTASALACSWDRDLMTKMGEALGEECQSEDVNILLGPGVNIKRSPLCGRNFEYFSEDPLLASELAANYVKGVQSLGVGTSLKHFAANNQEHRRLTVNAEIDERTLREIYLSAFERVVKEAQPWTIMCAYNRVNGTHASEHKRLLTDILKEEWGHEGFVVSDWGAVNYRDQGVEAGLELEMPSSHGDGKKAIVDAVEAGTLSKESLNRAAERILKIVFKAVEESRDDLDYDKKKHHKLAREIAADSMVLLKNEDNILPLSEKQSLGIVGAFARKPRFQGGGSSHINPYQVDTAYSELKKYSQGELPYAEGYLIDDDHNDSELIAKAKELAEKVDKVVVFAGLPDRYESEGYDRDTLEMPPNQNHLINELSDINENIIVVLSNGSPVTMPWLNRVKAVLEGYLTGQAGGGATADILFGRVNPSGKLAETFPQKLSDNPSYLFFPGEKDKVEYREGIFVGYRYYDSKEVKPLFPFGFGLSYTDFEYSDLKIDKEKITDQETLKLRLKVKNTGKLYGKEIVQLYVADPESTVIKPTKELKEFIKVELEPGQEKIVEFELGKRAFAYYNTEIDDWYVESGDYEILIGSSSRDIRLKEKIKVESTVELYDEYTINTNIGDIISDPEAEKYFNQLLEEYLKGTELMERLEGRDDEMMEAMFKYMPLRSLAMFSEGAISRIQVEEIVEKLNKKL
ncbi:glycoside hydrolase family 3 protein [Halanaerobium sp.]|uniref:Beta-glucosidase n=2 Tax=Halanaerobium congolense TaxID=54121 RepID=A0A1G6KNS5_9FIRM|nr:MULTISPECIES: glycoside hydrolase family 3 C-terminal domain-containing protein [Halanaerobium]PUU90216.1 MAG: beta-glucosidase [Halanaerobium sp.]PXV64042.1 beta-glucosidase [Halanaerobium congolense]SDC31996.1 beta-glucosidase [Halanaerobium congolense]